jgi:hypothetical protein
MPLGPPPISVTPLKFSSSIVIPPNFIGTMFTDNALIYYKTHSLARAGTNGVRNSRAIARRT